MSTATINLGGLTKAAPKAAKKEKPFLPDPSGQLTPMVTAGIANKQHIEAQNAALDQIKARFGEAAFTHACQLYQGRAGDIEDTFQIGTAAGKALISLKNAYKLPENLAGVKELLGKHATDVIKESFSIEINAESIPAFLLQGFIDELVKLARQMDEMTGTPEGQDGAVFQAITVKHRAYVDKSFHEARYRLFTPEQNAALHRAMPCVVSIKFDY